MAVLDDVLAELSPPARRSSTRVEADSVTVEHDRDAAVVLWQWPAAAPKDVGRYDQLVATYGDWTRSRHAP
jgi:hypothetical protein